MLLVCFVVPGRLSLHISVSGRRGQAVPADAIRVEDRIEAATFQLLNDLQGVLSNLRR